MTSRRTILWWYVADAVSLWVVWGSFFESLLLSFRRAPVCDWLISSIADTTIQPTILPHIFGKWRVIIVLIVSRQWTVMAVGAQKKQAPSWLLCYNECPSHFWSAYPFFHIDPTRYPLIEKRRVFIAMYLSKLLRTNIKTSDHAKINPVLDAVERFQLACHMLWGFWSVIRAPQAATATSFDMLYYGQKRWIESNECRALVLCDSPKTCFLCIWFTPCKRFPIADGFSESMRIGLRKPSW